MGGPGGGPMDERRIAHFEMMRNYLDIVDRYARLARDPNHAGIAAVVGAADILKPRGTDAAIEYFNKLLPDVKSPAVQRAVRIQLIELYKQAGKQDQALEQLRTLMTAEISPSELTSPNNPPPPGRP
jgi:thioredoxin-like negative regulator of GroEL